jgi:DNA polymerase-3 subunit delta'
MIWSNHTDVSLVRPYNRVIRIDPMRQLDREANFRPYEGNARVFIVEDADKMNKASSNALLKTLEEPPVTTYLILITSRPASLLPTIRSRCQTIRFVPLSRTDIGEYLIQQDKNLSENDARLRASAARGSLGRALSVDLDNFREQRNAMLNIVDALTIDRDRTHLLRAAEELCDAKRKDEYEPQLSVLETLLHDVWTLSLDANAASLDNDDLREHLSRVVTQVESKRVARWLTQIEKHRRTLDVNINRKVATDGLFLKMAE